MHLDEPIPISKSNDHHWEVPYLPIDPSDIGRTYEAIIRVNSQSGKAGSAWLLEQEHNINIPRGAQIQFSEAVQNIADKTGKEIKKAWGMMPCPKGNWKTLMDKAWDDFLIQADRSKFKGLGV